MSVEAGVLVTRKGKLFRGEVAKRGGWVLACPFCGAEGALDRYVVVHGDGTVSISPPVACLCGARFVVERGVVKAT